MAAATLKDPRHASLQRRGGLHQGGLAACDKPTASRRTPRQPPSLPVRPGTACQSRRPDDDCLTAAQVEAAQKIYSGRESENQQEVSRAYRLAANGLARAGGWPRAIRDSRPLFQCRFTIRIGISDARLDKDVPADNDKYAIDRPRPIRISKSSTRAAGS